MKRFLLGQMVHEWKTNIWLIIELAIVTLVIWLIFSILWSTCKGLLQPRGFTPENVYTIRAKSIPKDSPYYLADYADQFEADRDELLRRLKENPNVEYVSLHNNFSPYELMYVGNRLLLEGEDSLTYSGNFRIADPEIIKLLEVRSTTGKSLDELTSMLERGEVLISKYNGFMGSQEDIVLPEDYIGRKAYLYGQEDRPVKIGDIVYPLKRSDFEIAGGMAICPFDLRDRSRERDIILRIKEGKGNQFENDFYSDYEMSHLRNVYLTDLTSLVKKGEALNKEKNIQIRCLIGVSIFMLLTIFLGLLGSFWFRVQQRISEIAIRKTFGAKNKDIFRRVINEGLILLLAGVSLISMCVWPFIDKLKGGLNEKWYTFLTLELITVVVMAVGIALSLWYPAWRAMKIEPAVAIKDE